MRDERRACETSQVIRALRDARPTGIRTDGRDAPVSNTPGSTADGIDGSGTGSTPPRGDETPLCETPQCEGSIGDTPHCRGSQILALSGRQHTLGSEQGGGGGATPLTVDASLSDVRHDSTVQPQADAVMRFAGIQPSQTPQTCKAHTSPSRGEGSDAHHLAGRRATDSRNALLRGTGYIAVAVPEQIATLHGGTPIPHTKIFPEYMGVGS